MAYKVRRASTPAEELEAFHFVNQWSGRYAVCFRDQHGAKMGPAGTPEFDYDRIAYVTVEWPSGYRVERRLLDVENLITLMGE
jgi:hypothetical protein